MPNDTTVTRELLCELTSAELLERGNEMASCELKAQTLKDERRRLNASIREQTDRMKALASAIDSRRELREVTCQWQPDYAGKRWSLARLDTGESLPEERPMSTEDLQERLPEVDAPARKPKRARAASGGARKRAKKAKAA